MGELIDAAVGFPGVVLSSALAVVVCFWLLVAVGVGRVDSFDEDADLGAVGLGGVPVSVAVSLLTCTGWAVSLAGTLAVARTGWTGLAHAAGDMGVLVVSVLVAWGVTRALAPALARAFRERTPGPVPRDGGGAILYACDDTGTSFTDERAPEADGLGSVPEADGPGAAPAATPPAAPADDNWPHADCA
ncbi:hypothetical protein [Streptomyces aureoverticillatus]|uniref:hypothetical protein n=1 Tax=Streptomyces aureoverticillatus TaxID=66871 RepID=UPI0013DABF50|nr:hypothetical protein [Streptomyces aureoverticillatus]QIB47088.1 hypothetical protein G3H79_32415 [Streptomyces aureoverticillatus]